MKKLIFISLIFVVFACRDKQSKMSIQDPDYLMLNDSVDVYGLHYSDESFLCLFDSISLIRLETNKNCFLGTIKDIIIEDDKLIVIDVSKSKQIVVFDTLGNYSHHIGNVGKGPGEFLSLTSVCSFNKEVIVYDNYGQKALLYDTSGGLIRQSNLKTIPMAISGLNDSTYAVFYSNIKHNETIISICDSNFSERYSFFPFQNDRELLHGVQLMVKNDNGSFLFFEPYSNNIYEIDTESNIARLHHKILINPDMEYDKILEKSKEWTRKEYLDKLNRSNVGNIIRYYELPDNCKFIQIVKNGAAFFSKLDTKNSFNKTYKAYDTYPKFTYAFSINGQKGNTLLCNMDKYFYDKLPKDIQQELLNLIPYSQREWLKNMKVNDNPIVLQCNLK